MKTVFDFEKIEIDIFVSGSRLSVHMDQQSIDYIISFLGKYAYKDIYIRKLSKIYKNTFRSKWSMVLDTIKKMIIS